MRVTALHFRGFASAAVKFAPVFDKAPASDQDALSTIVERLADAVIVPGRGHFTALTIVGLADQRDDAVPDDERRASECEACTQRALDAWEWVRQRVGERLAEAGIDGGEWWDTSGELTWSIVCAATATLGFNLLVQGDRALDRGVIVLASFFDAP